MEWMYYFYFFYIIFSEKKKEKKKITAGWSSLNEIQSVAYFVQANRGSNRVQEKEINMRQHCVGNK